MSYRRREAGRPVMERFRRHVFTAAAPPAGDSRHGRIAALHAAVLLGMTGQAAAQQAPVDEIIVTAPQREHRALQPAMELDRSDIAEWTPFALTDVFEALPSVGIRTNSRGEAVLRLRGSEERQTGVFLDGAPLSVPWDGRVDLSALPAGIVDAVSLTASAAPIEYGSHSVLGVVDIRTPVSVLPGVRDLRAEVGTEDAVLLSAVAGADAGGLDWLFGAGYRRVGGEAVSSPAVIPYGPVADGARANTDLESASLFIAANAAFPHGSARASLLSVGAERGIANAGHISPDAGSPRYWRYPHWRFDQLTVNVAGDIGAHVRVRSTVWLQHFEQTIDQYTDDSYSLVESTEHDKDDTTGLRVVLERPFEHFDLRLVGNAQVTVHDQVDIDHMNEIGAALVTYQQNTFSMGAEQDIPLRDDLVVSAALSYNRATTPKTGGRDAQDDISEWAASIAARWYPTDEWEIAGTLGERTRFPTLRELYGEALGQFLVNPDLSAESALLGDLTFLRTSHDGKLKIRITPWILRVDQTLSQRRVVRDGTQRRQRYNLEGSDGHGVEMGIDWAAGDRFEVRLNGSWQDLEARTEADGTRQVLYLRPRVQASLAMDWVIDAAWDLFFEVRHTGTAYDEDEDGAVVSLPTATSANVRLFRTMHYDDSGRWRVYAGIDNLGDEIILPQLGLPQPGRTASLGFVFERM